MSCNYTVLDSIPPDNDPCWNGVEQTPATVRKSLDGLKCIVKWSNDIPEGLNNITVYDNDGMLSYLVTNSVDWEVAE